MARLNLFSFVFRSVRSLVILLIGITLGMSLLAVEPNLQTAFAVAPSAPVYCVNQSAVAITPLVSPGMEDSFARLLLNSKSSIDVEMYAFTSKVLRDELASAVQRGVTVRVILEPRVETNAVMASFLKESGVQVRWASRTFTNTHSKLAIIDGRKVLIGSTNWSAHALNSNRETSVTIADVALASYFGRIFESDWQIANAVK